MLLWRKSSTPSNAANGAVHGSVISPMSQTANSLEAIPSPVERILISRVKLKRTCSMIPKSGVAPSGVSDFWESHCGRRVASLERGRRSYSWRTRTTSQTVGSAGRRLLERHRLRRSSRLTSRNLGEPVNNWPFTLLLGSTSCGNRPVRRASSVRSIESTSCEAGNHPLF